MGEEAGVALPLSEADRKTVLSRLEASKLDIPTLELPALISAVETALLAERETSSDLALANIASLEDEKLETAVVQLVEGLSAIQAGCVKLSTLLPDENGCYVGSPRWGHDYDPFEIAIMRLGVDLEDNEVAIVIEAIRLLSAQPEESKMQPGEAPPFFLKGDDTPVGLAFRLVDAVMRFRLDLDLGNANTWHSPEGQGDRFNARRRNDELEPLSPAACTLVEIAAAFRLGFPHRTLRNHMNQWKVSFKMGNAIRQSIRTGTPLSATKLTPKKRSRHHKRLS